jgi:hypothetical protein
MRAIPNLLAVAIAMTPGALSAQNIAFEASSTAIHNVISGKKCVGDDLLKFGASELGETGSYERIGRPPGDYQIGYGTILIRRGKDLHSHVATVSTQDHMLYLSTGKYHCDP